MENEKKSSFTVTDRRKFTVDGESRPESASEESSQPEPQVQQQSASTAQPTPAEPPRPAPTAQEQTDQASRYQQSSRELDSQLQHELDAQGQGRKASDFEITFEKFVASLYMTALLQLGLVHEQGGQPTDAEDTKLQQLEDRLRELEKRVI